jgi:hypothetical protein
MAGQKRLTLWSDVLDCLFYYFGGYSTVFPGSRPKVSDVAGIKLPEPHARQFLRNSPIFDFSGFCIGLRHGLTL